MKNKKIIEHYTGYIENLINEGEKFTLESALNYAMEMFQEDTDNWKDCRANRFIGKDNLQKGLKERFIKIGLH